MDVPFPTLAQHLGDSGPWLQDAAAAVGRDRKQLAVLFPQLPRRLGREGNRFLQVRWVAAGENDAIAASSRMAAPRRIDLPWSRHHSSCHS